jgi:hypothetical protein
VARAASEAGQSRSSVDREARRSKSSARKFKAGAQNSQVEPKNLPPNPQPRKADVQGAGRRPLYIGSPQILACYIILFRIIFHVYRIVFHVDHVIALLSLIIAQDVKKNLQTRSRLQESNQKVVMMTTTMMVVKIMNTTVVKMKMKMKIAMKMVLLPLSLPSPQQTAGKAMWQAMHQGLPLQYVPPPPCIFQPFKLLGTVVPQVQADNRLFQGIRGERGGPLSSAAGMRKFQSYTGGSNRSSKKRLLPSDSAVPPTPTPLPQLAQS